MTERAVTAPARVPQSRGLAESLHRAHTLAREQGARHVALEHLLLSLLTDPETSPVLTAAGIDLARLETDLHVHLETLPDKLLPGEASEPEWHPDLLRMLDYSMAAAAQSGRPAITGAIVLAALIGEGKTVAARLLRAQGLTFEAAIGAMRASHGHEGPGQEGPGQKRRPSAYPDDRLPPSAEGREIDRYFEAGPGPEAVPPHERSVPPVARPPASGSRVQSAPPARPPASPPERRSEPSREPFPPVEAIPPSAPARQYRDEPPPAPMRQPPPRGNPPPPQQHSRPLPPRGGPAAPFPEASPPSPARSAAASSGGPPLPGHSTGPVVRDLPTPHQAGPHQAGPHRSGAEATAPHEPHLPPMIAPGELVENIPRRMRVGITEMIEVRIARDKIDGLEIGLQGRGMPVRHDLYVTKAMVVRLKSPDGSFWVEPGSPETQWIENSLGLLPGEFARWRFSVTPRRRGSGRLQLVVSARTVGSDGLAAETALPDQTIEVKVRTNYGRLFKSVGGWTAAMLIGGVLGKFGERLVELGLVFSRKFGGP